VLCVSVRWFFQCPKASSSCVSVVEKKNSSHLEIELHSLIVVLLWMIASAIVIVVNVHFSAG
jgi:hypothetical protein